ncbi:hypothetical protein ACFL2V_12370 [Pseudomonadota bacterium]
MGSHIANKTRMTPILFLVSLLAQQTAFAEVGVVGFNEKLIEKLPPSIILESLKESQKKGKLELQSAYLDFGKEVCSALSKGGDKKTIMENMKPILGEGLSGAIYETALAILCPENKK